MTAPGHPEDGALRRRLRGLRVDPPDAGFSAALHRRLAEAGPPPAPARLSAAAVAAGARRLLWPLAGVAAGLAAYALVAAVHGRPGDEAAVRVPASQVALVHLNLGADVAVAAADLRVSLPEGLSFWVDGQPLAERSFAWRQPLAAGDNEIPIAVRGQRPGRYHVTVSATVGSARIEHDVLLEVTGT